MIDTPEGQIELKNDFVFAMTGYRPDLTFLEAHGIRLDPETKRPYTNPETLESDCKGIYLAGVLWQAGLHTNEIFIENGRFHGKIIAEASDLALLQSRFSICGRKLVKVLQFGRTFHVALLANHHLCGRSTRPADMHVPLHDGNP